MSELSSLEGDKMALPTTTFPTIDALHRDIAFANQYRLEMIKHLMAIAGALFAFTIAFRPNVTSPESVTFMLVGWVGLGFSMAGGLFHMLGWDHFYKSYRDYDHRNEDGKGPERGKAARQIINRWRRVAMTVQFAGFLLGVASIGWFAAVNTTSSGPTLPTSGPTSPAGPPPPARSSPP